MTNCIDCKGEGCIDISSEQDGSILDGCRICDGRGEIDTTCKCGAWTPFECCCSVWNDVDLEYWEED